jgi:hypothetical protein
MSIKIYEGARIAGIDNHQDILAEIATRIERVAMEEVLDDAAMMSVSTIDSRIVAVARGPLQEAATELNDERKVFTRLWHAVDKKTGTVAFYNAGPSAAFKVALTVDRLNEYGYWNSSDRPKELTRRQWEARESFWKRVTPTGYLKQTMHDIAILRPTLDVADPMMVDQVVSRVQDRSRRARNVASSLTFDGRMETMWRILSSGADTEGLDELIAAIEPLLAEITVELLTEPRPVAPITLERYPQLATFVDAVKSSLARDVQ